MESFEGRCLPLLSTVFYLLNNNDNVNGIDMITIKQCAKTADYNHHLTFFYLATLSINSI